MMFQVDQSPLGSYNSLLDRHLSGYFANNRIRKHLIKTGLITKQGEVVNEAAWRAKIARKEHKRRLKDALATAIVNKVIDMEKNHRLLIRNKLEEISRDKIIKDIKESRSKNLNADRDMQIIALSPRPQTAPIRRRLSASVARKPRKSKTSKNAFHEVIDTIMSDEDKVVSHFQDISEVKPFDDPSAWGSYKTDPGSLESPYSKLLLKPKPLEPRPPPEPKRSPRKSVARRKLKKTKSEPKIPVYTRFVAGNRMQLQSLCNVTMKFLGLNISLKGTVDDQLCEVVVLQQHCGGSTLCIYKGKLTPNTTFKFTSRRHRGSPFGLTVYVNGMQDIRVSACCEYKHRAGQKLGSHFVYVGADGAAPCYKCLATAKMLSRAKSPNKPKIAITDTLETNSETDESIPVLNQRGIELARKRPRTAYGSRVKNSMSEEEKKEIEQQDEQTLTTAESTAVTSQDIDEMEDAITAIEREEGSFNIDHIQSTKFDDKTSEELKNLSDADDDNQDQYSQYDDEKFEEDNEANKEEQKSEYDYDDDKFDEESDHNNDPLDEPSDNMKTIHSDHDDTAADQQLEDYYQDEFEKDDDAYNSEAQASDHEDNKELIEDSRPNDYQSDHHDDDHPSPSYTYNESSSEDFDRQDHGDDQGELYNDVDKDLEEMTENRFKDEEIIDDSEVNQRFNDKESESDREEKTDYLDNDDNIQDEHPVQDDSDLHHQDNDEAVIAIEKEEVQENNLPDEEERIYEAQLEQAQPTEHYSEAIAAPTDQQEEDNHKEVEVPSDKLLEEITDNSLQKQQFDDDNATEPIAIIQQSDRFADGESQFNALPDHFESNQPQVEEQNTDPEETEIEATANTSQLDGIHNETEESKTLQEDNINTTNLDTEEESHLAEEVKTSDLDEGAVEEEETPLAEETDANTMNQPIEEEKDDHDVDTIDRQAKEEEEALPVEFEAEANQSNHDDEPIEKENLNRSSSPPLEATITSNGAVVEEDQELVQQDLAEDHVDTTSINDNESLKSEHEEPDQVQAESDNTNYNENEEADPVRDSDSIKSQEQEIKQDEPSYVGNETAPDQPEDHDKEIMDNANDNDEGTHDQDVDEHYNENETTNLSETTEFEVHEERNDQGSDDIMENSDIVHHSDDPNTLEINEDVADSNKVTEGSEHLISDKELDPEISPTDPTDEHQQLQDKSDHESINPPQNRESESELLAAEDTTTHNADLQDGVNPPPEIHIDSYDSNYNIEDRATTDSPTLDIGSDKQDRESIHSNSDQEAKDTGYSANDLQSSNESYHNEHDDAYESNITNGAHEVNTTSSAEEKQGLDLVSASLTHDQIKELATMVETKESLDSITVRNSNIDDESLKMLSESIQKSSANITMLNLNLNRIGPEGGKHVIAVLRSQPSIEILMLHGNPLQDEGVKNLVDGLIEIGGVENSNDQLSMESSSRGMSEKLNLNHIDLGDCNISDAGAKDIARLLVSCPSITTLNLSGNPSIGPNGWKAIADSLKVNSTITTLSLDYNRLGDEGAAIIADGIKHNKSISSIDLDSNHIGDEGGRHLLEAVRENSRIADMILMPANSISEDIRNHIMEQLLFNAASRIKNNSPRLT
ncbi:Glutamate-rich protein 3 [Trichoplax sp. H2]|nr:Glutamate-rich protein 3 [Trichoplax sp. H2]|eukprot:RDD47784.1 Glutamate-rich protein 3 [Trichoplax sp. H2]